ncbi:dipeptidyl-peptidase IV [Clostridium beijerinckii]|uniref:dipeptidyl-peptidase IV n=1 Tax=Clostridium beijerinckii TaxID=1520 RepID=UPI00232D6153|nr:dipeptidyl-peptidase IV [Clostridium beijerinckii]
MKMFKKITAWALLSILLQISGLYILENFIFKHTSEFKSNKIEVQKKDNTKDISASIPSSAKDTKISDDGKYICYQDGESVYLEDTKTGASNPITTEKNGTIMYYDWLLERDILVIAQKIEKDGEYKVQLITYNAKDSTETVASKEDICTYQEGMEVKKITTSVFTGVFYVEIYTGGLKSTVYRFDRDYERKKVPLAVNVLGNMKVMPHNDRLIYEDKLNSKFFVTSPNKQLVFNGNKNLTLLGIDRNDVIYVGELNGDKITNITYGKVDEDTANWKKVTLDSVVNVNDLYFSNKSEILVNDNLKGSVKNLSTGKEVEYEGKLVQIKEDFIATEDNSGKLVYKSLNDNK